MATIDTSTVSIGDPTKKADYDRLRANDQVLASGSVTLYGAKYFAGGAKRPLFHIQHTANGDAGSLSLGWNTRPLNYDLTDEITGASRSGNYVLLPTGTYWVEWVQNARGAAGADRSLGTRFRNATDGETVLVGLPVGLNDDFSSAHMVGYGRVTIATTKAFLLQMYASGSGAGMGQGMDGSPGERDVHADLRIWKVS